MQPRLNIEEADPYLTETARKFSNLDFKKYFRRKNTAGRRVMADDLPRHIQAHRPIMICYGIF